MLMKKTNLSHDNSMWKGASPKSFRHAKYLWENPTEAENKLWKELQLEPFKQYHFRRQHPIHQFIADFYSHGLKLIIEVDGQYHENGEQLLKDEQRTELLESLGIKVIRFSNKEVLENTAGVLQTLLNKIKT